MNKEIEKKYLIYEDGIEYITSDLKKYYSSIERLKKNIKDKGIKINQGYISLDKLNEILTELKINVNFVVNEIRLRNIDNNKFLLTLKSKGSLVRDEFEIEIKKEFFDKYWSYTKSKRLEKFRLKTDYDNYIVEFDMYSRKNLIIAEIEFNSTKDIKEITPLGIDITGNSFYKNRNLAN